MNDEAVSGGWPRFLSNIRSLLETEEIILKARGAVRGRKTRDSRPDRR
jgi:hypothetical protein